MLIFGFLVLLPWYLQPLKKPDVVIGSTVHFFAALSGLVLARRFKVPFVFEVRDVWPDTLVDLGKLNPSGLLAQVMVFVSRFLAKRSDLVVSPLPRVSNYLEDLGAFGVPSLWIPNGAEASLLPNAAPPPARNPFVFMYLGSQGNTNELDLLVDAFDLFWNDNPHQDMRLRIIGDGPLKNQLEHRVSTLACRAAISFEPRVPRRVALERSREAHCMVLPAKSLAVYKYGMSPNKLFDYFLSARPVLMSSVDPTHPVSSIGAGLEVVPNSAEAFAEAMALVVSMTENELSAMGSRGRVAAETIYSYEHLAMSLARGLDSVASGGKMH
jgi:glycosyltransferase involved in cell wall biosynthesis